MSEQLEIEGRKDAVRDLHSKAVLLKDVDNRRKLQQNQIKSIQRQIHTLNAKIDEILTILKGGKDA